MNSNSPIEILKQYWGFDTFRPLQSEIITAVLSHHDVLALLPTSAGKSVCFQVPGMILPGVTLVITPLIALMKNQVENLKAKNINAEAIYSGMHKAEVDRLLDNAVYGGIKFLYVSPERLKNKLFLERLKRMTLSLLVVDEAHCISEWGYDFRPPYLEIANIKNYLPTLKTIALTASATQTVSEDICEKLLLKNPQLFNSSFIRNNINYVVKNTIDKEKHILNILKAVKGTAIIYTRNRRKTQNVAKWLEGHGYDAEYYHAGLEISVRNKKQEHWLKASNQIMVATNAFGMGIDKPNVRLVIHTDIPESIEAYYQEAGRAGRDSKKSYAVLLYNETDGVKLLSKINEKYPATDTIRRVYQALANFNQIPVGSGYLETYPFDLEVFCHNFSLKVKEVMASLDILAKDGFILFNDAVYHPPKIQILWSNAELYNYRLKNGISDTFFKTLLRLYGGAIFTDFVNISMAELTKYSELTGDQIKHLLKTLNQQNIISYLPQSSLPTITYLTERQNAEKLPINELRIKTLKTRDIAKAENIIYYAQNENTCKQKLLVEYFDQQLEQNCGHCDYCLALKKTTITSQQKIARLAKNIEILVANKPMLMQDFTKIFDGKDLEYLPNALQLLLESKKIIQDKLGLFTACSSQ